jgi:hypothetical protein
MVQEIGSRLNRSALSILKMIVFASFFFRNNKRKKKRGDLWKVLPYEFASTMHIHQYFAKPGNRGRDRFDRGKTTDVSRRRSSTDSSDRETLFFACLASLRDIQPSFSSRTLRFS